MSAPTSNFRNWSESDDLNYIHVTVETMPNHEQVVVFNLPGMQDLVDKATRTGFRPTLVTWAEGFMADYYEQAADEDEEMGFRFAHMSPVERREFIEQQARSMARALEDSVEHHGFEPIPDISEPGAPGNDERRYDEVDDA